MHAKPNEGIAAAADRDTRPQTPIPPRLRITALALRAAFISVLVVLTARVSVPQSETIWSAPETPGDLIRLALGFVVCLWMLIHLFMVPKDPGAYRTWIYLGLAGIPLAVICAIAIW